MEKQKLTSSWVWRDGEMSYADFGKMGRMGKDEHILYLSSLGEHELGTNDWYILNQYAPHLVPVKKTKEFLELEDEHLSPTEWAKVGDISFIDKLISTEETTIDEYILNEIDEKNLEKHLNKFFEIGNVRWNPELKFASSVDNFIECVKTYMEIDELTITYIKLYKEFLNK